MRSRGNITGGRGEEGWGTWDNTGGQSGTRQPARAGQDMWLRREKDRRLGRVKTGSQYETKRGSGGTRTSTTVGQDMAGERQDNIQGMTRQVQQDKQVGSNKTDD